MPKDAKKNVDRYKIRGGEINEFDFHRNQQEFTESTTKNIKTPTAAKITKGASAKKPAARKAAKK